VIAARLSDEQIDSVTRYFASVQPAAKPAPSTQRPARR
jgi:cytochrome c553